MTSRETLFECTLESAAGSHCVLVRAWSEDEAEEVFRELLAAEGVTGPGEISVRPLGRGAERRGTWKPAVSAA